MKKKISVIQIFRHIIQITFFILLPGLFALAFGQVKLIYTMILKGDFNFIQAFPRLIAAVAIIPITIFFGRLFCGWFCAFGSFNDFLYMISSKVFKTKFKVNRKLDSILKLLKYFILVFIVFVIWTKGNTLFDNSSPWDAFALITNFPKAITSYFIGFILLAFITVGAIYIERFFCRYLCPLGAIFVIISKFRKMKIDKPTEKCGKCRICTNNCAMGINLYKMEQVSSGECISCLKCIDVCPRSNPRISYMGENLNPAFASSIAIVAFATLYGGSTVLGSIISANTKVSTSVTSNDITKQGDNTNSNIDNTTQTKTSKNSDDAGTKANSNITKTAPKTIAPSSTTNSKYKDGTYIGTGYGYMSNINVSVIIKNDKITNVKVDSINDSYKEPVNVIPQEIVQTQSSNVDVVSGATHTSNGIMSAASDALSKAKNQ
ncbi:4Fe-4S binding protein [Clostridium estertheticum]|uniref:4Fe-4S binding protein n=1 Tax=Clostridium estertheticum TaxID=238834 RepID=UPI001C7D5A05|nr:4Fe-4S binding protein [Clostridium estertheticum]MBX4270263.1 4Fe-4S binding protein [Clostridium estertheticum]WLC79765.1 4Fe-4S binding protein [Clostridium estertheticum]